VPQLNIDIVHTLFPFSFFVDRKLRLTRIGPKWSKITSVHLEGALFSEVFEIARPVLALSVEALAARANDIFMLGLKGRSDFSWRGQVMHCTIDGLGDMLIFVGGPWLTRLAELSELGLELNDFPPHDPRADLLMLMQGQVSYLEDLRELTGRLRSSAVALEARSRQMEGEMARRAKLETQLRQSQKMEALGRLAGGVAHDFNNILLAIDGYAALALAALPEGGAANASLSLIRTAADRAAGLTRQLLAFTRQTPLVPKPIDIGRDIREIETLILPLTKGRVTVVVDAPPGLGLAWADRTAVQQIVMNLSINAIDAMPQGGELTVRVRLAEESPGLKLAAHGYLEIAVSDNGCGMDEVTQSRLFEPFFTTKPPGRGTGLGLSTVHALVEQCGGLISCESALGVGSTFRVYLPRVENSDVDPVAESVKSGEIPTGAKVLFVEDDAMVRHLVNHLLVSGGFQVTTSARPEEALALLRAGLAVDVIVTDVVMPHMTGTELVRVIEAERGPMPTVFISGHTTDSMFRSGELPPRFRFLRKPFPPFQLIKEVRSLLATQSSGVTGA
jgi:signal transduction histidine kinase